MNQTFSDDESVAWPSYVDFLSTFAILMVLFAGYMAFLLSNGVEQTVFLFDAKRGGGHIKGARVNLNTRQISIDLGDTLTFQDGCPKRGCAELSSDQSASIQRVAGNILKFYPNARHITIQGRADATGTDQENFRVAGDRAYKVLSEFNRCESCPAPFLKKMRIGNVGNREAGGRTGANLKTVVIILEYGRE